MFAAEVDAEEQLAAEAKVGEAFAGLLALFSEAGIVVIDLFLVFEGGGACFFTLLGEFEAGKDLRSFALSGIEPRSKCEIALTPALSPRRGRLGRGGRPPRVSFRRAEPCH